MIDLRAFATRPARAVPAGATLGVLAADPWTGNVWVSWYEADGTGCRALVHESDLDFVAEFRRRLRGAADAG